MKRVYFIRPIGMTGPIKIGCSLSPDTRRRTLETWSPYPLEVVAEIEGGYLMEKRFHTLFVGQHIHHEWFEHSDELEQVVAAVAANTFDVASLPEPKHLGRARRRDWATEGWRYHRSISARIQNMRKRGLTWDEVSRSRVWDCSLEKMTSAELAVAKLRIEPVLAAWAARFPSATQLARTPKKLKQASAA